MHISTNKSLLYNVFGLYINRNNEIKSILNYLLLFFLEAIIFSLFYFFNIGEQNKKRLCKNNLNIG